MFRPHVIFGIASRNIKTFFTSVIGYLFIVVFVVVSGIIAFGPKFFADNLATLDQLTERYPLLLLFLVPAITMGIWADEKKQGTDAILFTLPASDLEILLGKYISVLVVYGAAVAFSLTQLIALANIGTPDWGVILSTYIGYLLAGAALLSFGMFASSLTSNTTVAFVLGAVLCSIPVFIGVLAPANQFLQSLSLSWQLREFGEGSVVLSSFLYFVFLKNIGLFLNYVAITRRHWSSDEESKMFGLYSAQVVSILIIAGSLYYVSAKAGSYYDTELDLTTQRLNTLSQTSVDLIEKASEKRRVAIQAFVSEEVPTEFVTTKKRLLRLLRQYSQIGGQSIDLRIVNVKPNSKTEREAIAAGVPGIDHSSEVGGRTIRQNVFMGLVFNSTIGETVVPEIHPGTSLEYELTRALGTVGVEQKKLRLGVLDTGAGYLGFPEAYQLNHKVVRELRKRYEVVRVTNADLTQMIEQQKTAAAEANSDVDEKDEADEKGESDEKKEAQDEKSDDASEQEKSNENDAAGDSKSESSDGEGAEDSEPELIVPDVLLVVRPSRISEQFQAEILEYSDLGNAVCVMVDPLNIYPWAVIGGEPGMLPESPTEKLVASSNGFRREEGENNDVSTLFDAWNIRWHGETLPVTIPGTPPVPNQFGGPPQPGRPERETEAFYPAVITQSYRPYEELLFGDVRFEFLAPPDQSPIELKVDLGPERDGVPTALGSPSAAMIKVENVGKYKGIPQDSVITSGIQRVLMFYAGGLMEADAETNGTKDPKVSNAKNGVTSNDKEKAASKDAATESESASEDFDPDLKFVPLLKAAPNSLAIPYKDLVTTEEQQAGFPPRSVKINRLNSEPNFYRFEVAIADLAAQIAEAEGESDAAEVERLTGLKQDLEKEQKRYALEDVCFAAQITGQRVEDGNEMNAVVIADIDFASNLFAAVSEQLNTPPDNIAFLMNTIDSLGGRTEFVELRSRNPVQRTLTYMDQKREEFRSERLAKEVEMRREYQQRAQAIDRESEKEIEASKTTGFAREIQEAFAAQDDEEKKEREKRKLQKKMDEQIAILKSLEAEKIAKAEFAAMVQGMVLPCLPALFLGIFVFVFRFIRERSHATETRRT